jgi:hypothetical protein
VAAALAGCAPDAGPSSAGLPSGNAEGVQLLVSSTDAKPGSLIAVVASPGDPSHLRGLQGRVVFDPTQLEYVGQPLEGHTLVIANHRLADSGEVRFLAFHDAGLAASDVSFVFRVRSSDYRSRLLLRAEAAVDDRGFATELEAQGGVVDDASLVVPSGARRLMLLDWVDYLGLAEPVRHTPFPLSAGDGYIFGDPTLNGLVTSLDAAVTANVAVGNLPLLVDPTRDYAVAANVAPFNLPGLGEANDPLPPGRNGDGSLVISVLDVASISNESLGRDQPVVGEPIPGRQLASNRVVVSGVIDSGLTRTFRRDTIYELQGAVDVLYGATLVIEAGTRIEADEATHAGLRVWRGGNLVATGTRLQPVVFTCNAPVPTRGCWDGIQISGFSVINDGAPGAGGNEVSGCAEKPAPNGGGSYGGCLPNDSSGSLRYVRIEYGGSAMQDQAALRLLGVGFATAIDSVQVYGSADDGILIAGGYAALRTVVLTNNAGAALRWHEGWQGRMQSLIVQQGADNGDAIVGANLTGNPDATPRSSPSIWNVTVTGTGPGSFARGLVLESGTAGLVRNVVVQRTGGAALDIVGTAACDQATAGGISLQNSVFFMGNPNFASDVDCIDEGAWALDPASMNRVVDPQLIGPYSPAAPDLRPVQSSPLGADYAIPPNDGFFDPTARFVGAVPPANATGNIVPWYAGWTRGWNGAP